MKSPNIFEITEFYKLYVDNSLEEYRCKTFFTKEPETVEWINTLFNNGSVFYDVGANVGIYAIYAALMYPEMLVYSFEPYIKNYQRLCDNIHLNNTTNIIPLHIALSNANSIETFFIKDERVGSSGNQLGSNMDEKGHYFKPLRKLCIPAYSLDKFINEFSLPIPTHIKLDVDGIEDKILDGIRCTLQSPLLKSILIEINEGETKSKCIIDIIRSYGFTINNPFNTLPNHSRHRRKGTPSETAENVIFVR